MSRFSSHHICFALCPYHQTSCFLMIVAPLLPPSTCRVVTIEMMEHVKNYETLLQRVSTWLKPGGKMFVHIFTHRNDASHFEKGWMAENFFTGGQVCVLRMRPPFFWGMRSSTVSVFFSSFFFRRGSICLPLCPPPFIDNVIIKISFYESHAPSSHLFHVSLTTLADAE